MSFEYFTLRDALADDIRLGLVAAEPAQLMAHVAARGGVDRSTAAETVERFLRDVRRDVERHREMAP